MKRALSLMMALALACSQQPAESAPSAGTQTEPQLSQIKLPKGFSIERYARVPGARSLCLDDQNTLWVGTRGKAVYAVPDKDRDLKADKVVKILDGLNSPNGIAAVGLDLYVAEIDKITRYPGLATNPGPVTSGGQLVKELPSDHRHGWRSMRLGPDGMLYLGIGAPLNVGEVSDPFGTVARLKTDGSGFEVIARGVRNTVGFDWHPETGVLHFTDNGRDRLSDELPPEELNRLDQPGQHFGFPYVYGNNQKDPDYGHLAPAGQKFTEPVALMDAHVAPLGMRFYRGTMFPAEYRNRPIIAQHGSWNRSTPLGYRLQTVDGAKATTFVEGWLQNGRAWGRPVDVQELSDGSLAVSDDHGGQIYRITYQP